MDNRNKARLRNSPSLNKGETHPRPDGLPASPLTTESALEHPEGSVRTDHHEEGVEGKQPSDAPQKGFGSKTISFWGSCALNFNNITGPAMVVLPLLFQQAGWLLSAVGLLSLWALSSFAATMLCEAMQKVPGNRGFARRLEYCTLVRHYFGPKWYLVSMVGFNAGLVASNIAAMIVTAQVLDSVVARTLGTTYGLSYGTWPPGLLAQGGLEEPCPWGHVAGVKRCSSSVITLGYVLAASVCIPMSFVSLEDNMWMQWISVGGQLAFSLRFLALYLRDIWPSSPTYCPGNGSSRTPLVGSDISQVVGISVFSYSYVSTIPSLANEMQPGVSINRAVWLPSMTAVLLNIALAVLGAWAYRLLDARGRPLEGAENILTVLAGRGATGTSCRPGPPPLSVEASAYGWGLTGYLPGIPVLAIMVRYNLQSGGLLGPRGALLVGVLLPWLLTAFCYQAEVLLQFCNWVAILCQGFINFVVPPLLYRAALLTYPQSADPTSLSRASGGPEMELGAMARSGSGRSSGRLEWGSRSSMSQGEGEEAMEVLDGAEEEAEESQGSMVDESASELVPLTWIDAKKLKSGYEKVTKRLPSKVRESEGAMPQHEAGLEQRSSSLSNEVSLSRGTEIGIPRASSLSRGMGLGSPGALERQAEWKELSPAARQRQSSVSFGSARSEEKSEHIDDSLSEEEKGGQPVDAVPDWIGIPPLEFATWMAIILTLVVCASIIGSVIQAVKAVI